MGIAHAQAPYYNACSVKHCLQQRKLHIIMLVVSSTVPSKRMATPSKCRGKETAPSTLGDESELSVGVRSDRRFCQHCHE